MLCYETRNRSIIYHRRPPEADVLVEATVGVGVTMMIVMIVVNEVMVQVSSSIHLAMFKGLINDLGKQTLGAKKRIGQTEDEGIYASATSGNDSANRLG